MNIPSIESLLAELDKVKAERDEYLHRCDALKSLGDMACDQIEIRENALREAKEALSTICQVYAVHHTNGEVTVVAVDYPPECKKSLANINKVLGEE